MSQVTQQHHRKTNCMVSRTIPVESALNPVQLHIIEADLKVSLHIDHGSDLMARYDASRIKFNQILEQLPTLGVVVKTSRWFRIKAAWYDFVDTNIASQTNERPKPCCNRIPRI